MALIEKMNSSGETSGDVENKIAMAKLSAALKCVICFEEDVSLVCNECKKELEKYEVDNPSSSSSSSCLVKK